MLDLFLVLLFCFLGVITGICTGLVPGFHVNNVALILLSVSSVFITSFSFLVDFGFSSGFILLLVGIYIISTSIAHTFLDCIPSTFLGAPDPDTALSVLPAHSLFVEGKGFRAVALSATGSFGAVVFCFILLIPVRFIIGEPFFFYEILKKIMFFVLLAISILMIFTEKGKVEIKEKKGIYSSFLGMLFAFFVFILSGFFGMIIFEVPVESFVGNSSPVLFPALAGLFGTSTLINSLMEKPFIPEQKIEDVYLDNNEKRSSILSVITGSIGGILVSIIPGITSATGTVLALNARGESSKEQTIVTLSAVNTACAFFVVIMMFVILRARSGAALAVMDLISISEWSNDLIPLYLVYFLIALVFSGSLAYLFTLFFGKIFAKKFAKVNYIMLVKITILFVVIMVFLFTSFMGLLVLLVATLIGLLPVFWGVRRSHCMGVLLFPILLYFV